jgi:hypothetical protein
MDAMMRDSKHVEGKQAESNYGVVQLRMVCIEYVEGKQTTPTTW